MPQKLIGRAEAQVLRLSALYAVLDRSRIPTPHLLAALAFWEYAEDSARRGLGDRLGDRVAEVIPDALRARGRWRPHCRRALDARPCSLTHRAAVRRAGSARALSLIKQR